MLGGLGATVDPILLAEKGARLTGRVPIQSMARFRAQLLDDAGEIDVDLAFECSAGVNLRRMHGRVVATVRLKCQRCLEPMMAEIVAEVDTILVRQDEADHGLPAETDMLAVAAPMAVAELIEDDLLLALPMVPMHALDECPARKYIGGAKGDTAKHPFAELARRKQD